jgi:phospholipase C
MGYFDGNTITALWNYAQYFAIGDNFFATMPGGSARGAMNLAAADVYGVLCVPDQDYPSEVYVPDDANLPFCNGPVDSRDVDPPSGNGLGTVISDPQPYYDVCSQEGNTVAMAGRNLGDLLNDDGITWGWFQGGFADCERSHPKIAYDLATGVDPATDPVLLVDYTPHWNPFQYWQSTANPKHLPPSSVAMIGRTDQANHLYDLAWFWKAVEQGNLPVVSFLKPATYQTGHPGLSDPLDQQVFLANTLNRLQRQPQWHHMAVIVAWDDSDGWADHVMPPIVNTSATSFDTGSEGQPLCGKGTQGPGARCAYGPRTPFLVISPYAKENYVSGQLADQTSITRFIEDNWLGGQRISDISFDNIAGSLLDMFDFSLGKRPRRLFIDPWTGQPLGQRPRRLIIDPWTGQASGTNAAPLFEAMARGGAGF